MARIRLESKGTYTWTSPVGTIRKGCVIVANLNKDFLYNIRDSEGKLWLAFPSELAPEKVEEVK